MKGNDGTGDIPARDFWETPQHFWDLLDEQYSFTFDCCAEPFNKKTINYSDNFEVQIKVPIDNSCWMNPPFSKAKEMFTHFFRVVKKGVAIYRCDNFETTLWQNIIFPNVDWIFILNKRLQYEGLKGNGSRFPSALVGIGVEPPVNLKGTVLFTRKVK